MASMEPAWVCTRSSVYGKAVSLVFLEDSSESLSALETLFLLLGCLVQPRYESFYLVLLSCFALCGCHVLENYSFLQSKQSRSGSGGEGR